MGDVSSDIPVKFFEGISSAGPSGLCFCYNPVAWEPMGDIMRGEENNEIRTKYNRFFQVMTIENDAVSLSS